MGIALSKVVTDTWTSYTWKSYNCYWKACFNWYATGCCIYYMASDKTIKFCICFSRCYVNVSFLKQRWYNTKSNGQKHRLNHSDTQRRTQCISACQNILGWNNVPVCGYRSLSSVACDMVSHGCPSLEMLPTCIAAVGVFVWKLRSALVAIKQSLHCI